MLAIRLIAAPAKKKTRSTVIPQGRLSDFVDIYVRIGKLD